MVTSVVAKVADAPEVPKVVFSWGELQRYARTVLVGNLPLSEQEGEDVSRLLTAMWRIVQDYKGAITEAEVVRQVLRPVIHPLANRGCGCFSCTKRKEMDGETAG